jgi:hypothetical protein
METPCGESSFGVGRVVSYDPDDGKELPPVDEELLSEPVERWATLDVIKAGCESGTMQVHAVGDTVEVVPDVAYNSRFRLVPDSG